MSLQTEHFLGEKDSRQKDIWFVLQSGCLRRKRLKMARDFQEQVGEMRVFCLSQKAPKLISQSRVSGGSPAFYCTTVDVDKWFWFLGPLKSITETEQPSALVSNSEYTPSVQLQRLQHMGGMIGASIISVPTLSNLMHCRQNITA